MPARFTPDGGAGGGGGSSVPTVTLLDKPGFKDSQALAWTATDDVGYRDALALASTQFDNLGLRDGGLITGLGTPQWQSVTTAALAAAGTSLAINMPPGVVAGDLLLAMVFTANPVAVGAPGVVTPAGWHAVSTSTFSGTVASLGFGLFWRIADGAEGASGSFTFTASAAQATAEIHRITGTVGHATTADSSSRGNTGVVDRPAFLPTVIASIWAGFGNALNFNGALNGPLTQGVHTSPLAGAVAGSYTLECKFYRGLTSFSRAESFMSWIDLGAASINGVFCYMRTDNKVECDVYAAGTIVASLISTTTVVASTNTDVAFVHDNAAGTSYLYVNGTKEATVAGWVSAPFTAPFTVGRGGGWNSSDANSPYAYQGRIDEPRFSSVARYTGATYTVATAPFTSDASTEVLWHLDSIVGTGNPIDGATTANLAAAALVTDPVSPTVTTSLVNTLVFAFLGHYHAALTNTHTAPASNDERTDFESTVTAVILASTSDSLVFAAAGATGTATHDCTETVATDAVMLRVAIAPGNVSITL